MSRFWWGSTEDSNRQAAERDRRAAKRTIKQLTIPKVDSDDEYQECDLSNSFLLNVDGADDQEEDEAVMAAFEAENGTDDADYYKKLASLKNRTFNKNEPDFWFTSFETSLKHIGVKSQWSKREVLHSLLPDDVQIVVKNILRKNQESAGNTPYKPLFDYHGYPSAPR